MKYVFLIVAAFLLTNISYSQKLISIQKESIDKPQSYPVPAETYLKALNEQTRKYIAAHPEEIRQMKKTQNTSWNFSVGSTHSWYAVNITNSQFYQVASTCRAIGAHSYIFVADDVWGTTVNQAAVDSVENEWENKTPADPNKGIYQTDVDTFGDPPDVDGDPRIIILIMDIKDGYNGSGGYVAGYFLSYNETGQAFSNKAEIYYMDANPTNLTTAGGLETAMETAAHEFQHMINYHYHYGSEATFINEGLSMFAEVNCGYPSSFQSLYAAEPNYSLFGCRGNDNTKVLTDYGRAQRFMIYLHDQFGVGIMKYIVQGTKVGIDGISSALNSVGQSITFNQVFINWEIANELNDRTVNPSYGYTYPNIPKSVTKTFYDPNVSATDTLYNQAAEYLTFTGGSNLNITISSKGSAVIAKAFETGDNGTQVVDVPLNQNFSLPEYGTTYKTITFAVLDTSAYIQQIYSYTATGNANTTATELKWDTTEPMGYLQLTRGDSVAVQFDGIPGAKLDSIRVALRGVAPINGSIYSYTGYTTQLGGTKLASFTATSALSQAPPVVNSTGDYPYAIPYQNWVTVDLTSNNIDASNPFVVEFPVGADYPTSNRVMITEYPSSSSYHSFAYESTTSPVTWTYYGVSGKTGYIFLFLVRAYVSFNTATGIKQTVELMPADYSLSQNYPNPFNPTTRIQFELPKASKVKIVVYNQIGQQVAQLANAEYPAGTHEVNFDGTSLSSGIYYYRIEAGSYVQTRKMVLLK